MGYIEPTDAERAAQEARLREIAEALSNAPSSAVQLTTVYGVWPNGGKPTETQEAS
jgi:hypothetical protein